MDYDLKITGGRVVDGTGVAAPIFTGLREELAAAGLREVRRPAGPAQDVAAPAGSS